MAERAKRDAASLRRRVVRGPKEWMIELVNPRTGERLQGEGLEGIPVVGKVRRRRYTSEFFLGIQHGMEHVATNKKLTHDARRVFLLMVSRVQWGNLVGLSQQEMAKRLDIDPARVSRAVKVLIQEKLISPKINEPKRKSAGTRLRPVKKGRSVVYEMNGEVVWKGSIDQQADYQRRWKRDLERWTAQREEKANEVADATARPADSAPRPPSAGSYSKAS